MQDGDTINHNLQILGILIPAIGSLIASIAALYASRKTRAATIEKDSAGATSMIVDSAADVMAMSNEHLKTVLADFDRLKETAVEFYLGILKLEEQVISMGEEPAYKADLRDIIRIQGIKKEPSGELNVTPAEEFLTNGK